MAIISYKYRKFSASSMNIIDDAISIIQEYMEDGLKLTLRQLYYQFVARGLLPNTPKDYKRLGGIINEGRLAGYIDWEAIEDRTRNLQSNSHWTDPGEIIKAARYSFKLDHWEGQEVIPEVWIEKEALIGAISAICRFLDVSYFACKGYVSQSEMWSASQRFIDREKRGVGTVIIHLGDHDPSGIDMTRDIFDRQELFLVNDIQVERIALNMDQVKKYNPPPNPAKITDTRCKDYIFEFGNESWELDALEPKVLQQLIGDKIMQYRNEAVYQAIIDREKEYKNVLENVQENWRNL